MKTLMYLFLFSLFFGIIGCTPYHVTLTSDQQSALETKPDNVQIFFHGETTPPAKELGSIVVSGNSEKHGVKFLREKAAKIGADAIINLEVKISTQTMLVLFIPIPINYYFVSGTAVKYNN